MSPTARKRDRRLATLQRLRELELDQARVERASIDAATDRHRRRFALMQLELQATQALERSKVTAEAGVCADLLRHARNYARWQAREIGEQEAVVKASERRSDEARLEVARRFERLAVIKRLRERGAREAALEETRAEYKNLDNQALVRINSDSLLDRRH